MIIEQLNYGNVSLVPYGQQHDVQTVAWLNGADLRNTFGITRSVSLESHRAWFANQRDLMMWAITSDGAHQGNISLRVLSRHASGYLQMYLGNPEARGKRIGWQALAALLDYAFRSLTLHRVWLHTLEDNQAAIALYKKAGFTFEGAERESILRDGAFHNQLRWSLLSREWRSDKDE